MNMWASKRGFTIVELIVVITVIAILATIVIVSYSSVQKSSRDSQRKSDVTQVKIALEKYYADNGQFPAVCSADGTACNISSLATPLNPYIQSIPIDPSGTANAYQYVRGGTNGNAYAIRIAYEAKAICKTGVRVDTVVISAWNSLPLC